VTGQARSPIDPVAVTFYDEPPARYDVVGIVEAASNVRVFSLEAAQERAFAELKQQAAKIGANGVIEWEVWEDSIIVQVPDQDTEGWTYRDQTETTMIAKGRAIYVSPISLNE
jgi:uncharacterized protein YbjQ (UPF0145 family)